MAKKRRKKKSLTARVLEAVLLTFLLWFLYYNMFYGRSSDKVTGTAPRVELSWEEAMADGVLSEEELAIHYAPEIDAAVNTLISQSGRGDFLAAVDYDGNTDASDNWEHIGMPLKAVVYWSVQETETHYFIGYDFYHPRDDAEIWLDRHENDFEGIMLAVPKKTDGFARPVMMYTQGHGGVPFFFDDISLAMTENSRRDGGLLLDGDRPVIYITPNGTLNNAGHSVESARDHSNYLYVGDSGVRYYHGGTAEEPATFNGPYESNRCSYELRSLQELYSFREGPYTGSIFASYGEFNGGNYEKNAANPPWAWRNKTAYGLSGTFLSDPAWTFARAISGLTDFSETYVTNRWADWQLILGDTEAVRIELLKNGTAVSNDSWFTIRDGKALFVSRDTLWAAGPKDTQWSVRGYDAAGNAVPVTFSSVYMGDASY